MRSDRPAGRALVRLGALALGPARAHRQDLWPHMEIDRASGAVRWRGRTLLRLEPFAALLPQGASRLAVVGSGPSLRGQPVERLAPGTAVLLNGAASLAGRVAPLAVAVEDERFVFRHGAMLAALPAEVPLWLSPAALRALAGHDPAALTGRRVALIDSLRKPVGGARRRLDDPALDPVLVRGPGGAALSRDPEAGVVIVGTVAFSALQIVLAAHPGEVLLAGIDLSNDAAPRFYEGADRAPSGLSRGLDRILAGFALARLVAEERGIRLACASPVSALLRIGYPPGAF